MPGFLVGLAAADGFAKAGGLVPAAGRAAQRGDAMKARLTVQGGLAAQRQPGSGDARQPVPLYRVIPDLKVQFWGSTRKEVRDVPFSVACGVVDRWLWALDLVRDGQHEHHEPVACKAAQTPEQDVEEPRMALQALRRRFLNMILLNAMRENEKNIPIVPT